MIPVLTPLAVGWHGKLPCRGDFVGRGLPPDWLRSWDDALRNSLAMMEQRGDPTLRQRLAALPPWQGLVLPTAPGLPAWLCLVLASSDAVGRAYPLLLAEAHAPVGLDTLSLAALRTRGRQWALIAQQALYSSSPQAFDQAAAALGAVSWRALPAAEGGADTVAHWRQQLPQGRSFWWPLQAPVGPDDSAPRAETWPPGAGLLAALLGP
ncbi:type VI secretion-associated protein, BMA_A0400 family [Burkholderiales bacterium JOSHI_001]|nr:type VI secretion-associated protein, BMA_A0400 family [Burkholderiales bacterium JOSHI_001]